MQFGLGAVRADQEIGGSPGVEDPRAFAAEPIGAFRVGVGANGVEAELIGKSQDSGIMLARAARLQWGLILDTYGADALNFPPIKKSNPTSLKIHFE